jgi:pre-mRNA cleavage complex 2 protein Pcf11
MWRGGQQPQRQAYPPAPGPGGGSGGYYAPPQPPTSAPAFQAQLQPQPQPPVDPFRSYYADRLRQLTFNSRPLIQELSVLAMQQRDAQHWPNMQSIVEEIEAAVFRVRRNFNADPMSRCPDAPMPRSGHSKMNVPVRLSVVDGDRDSRESRVHD